jgi:hypothetical protein
MREKVAEGRLKGQQRLETSLFPLTLTLALSLRERECFRRLVFVRYFIDKNNGHAVYKHLAFPPPVK